MDNGNGDDDPVDDDHLNDHDDDQLLIMSSTCVGLCVCVGSQVVPTTAQHLPPPLSVSPEPPTKSTLCVIDDVNQSRLKLPRIA